GDESDDAEVVEVECIGQQLGFIVLWDAMGQGDENVGGAVDQLFAGFVSNGADEQLGGLLGAIAQVGASELSGGEICGRAHRELKRVACQLQALAIGLIADQSELEK